MQRSGRIPFVLFHMITLQSFIIYDSSRKDHPASAVWRGLGEPSNCVMLDAFMKNTDAQFSEQSGWSARFQFFNCELVLYGKMPIR